MLKKNILNLFTNQIFSYIVPLLLLPYLSRTLDTNYFGLYIFSISTISIATIITNYGFDISIVKRIAEGENKVENISEFLFHINLIKTIICFITLIIIFLILYNTNYYQHGNKDIYIIMLSIFFSSFNLIWLFQGLEKIYLYSRITIITRIISMIAIVTLVKSPTDFSLLLKINLLQIFLSIILSYFIVHRWGIKLKYFHYKKAIVLFKESTEYFISRIGVTFYSSACGFFLGIFSGSLHQVAIYGAAEQLYRAGVYLMSAISSPLTPYMARTKNYEVFWKITAFTLVLSTLGALFGFLFGKQILGLIFGEEFSDSYIILNVFMIAIIISVLGMLFGYPALIPLNKTKVANFSVLYAGFLQLGIILVAYFLNIKFTALFIACSYLSCEIFVLLLRYIVFHNAYKNIKTHE
ncbi:oligosaccharide flippase family protein [Providencia rettgeri]|uniref:oligosaccharide flippase family protein n=1 Tax=Providencia rettgeri TaxID=587 RepID=UPI000CFEEBE5|nr:oligosaccharide flippase family protein [Providencia rettgeri]AVL73311.1 hypothetical protein CEQ08_06050 [Providencia rettgeri]EKH6495460.1 oligosaccharide flippase family protein [Providencia rettgeri]ELR5052729.1 oligosaccharide flippase family protein [Providencia rettgeri]ELR5154077.1 oligosaccharide flippase family protein [Providencia rettgeri]ELR5180645.1 oligosaccharide flippase family protein [Providencia rettgeri]